MTKQFVSANLIVVLSDSDKIIAAISEATSELSKQILLLKNSNPYYGIIIGFALGLVGSIFIIVIRMRLEKKDELACIKNNLKYDLKKISEIIDRIDSSFDDTKLFKPEYLEDAIIFRGSYDTHNSRLFIIRDVDFTNGLKDFYIKFFNLISTAKNNTGSLNSLDQNKNYANGLDIKGRIVGMKKDCESLITKIDTHKYKAYYIW